MTFRLGFVVEGPTVAADHDGFRFVVTVQSVHSRGLPEPIVYDSRWHTQIASFTWNARGARGREKLIESMKRQSAKQHRREASAYLAELRRARRRVNEFWRMGL